MNDARPAQQREADARPEVVVRRHHNQRLVRRLCEMDQIDDEHGVDQLLFLARQHPLRLDSAPIDGAIVVADERVEGGYRAA